MYGSCIVILMWCCVSIGISQMIKTEYVCGRSVNVSKCDNFQRPDIMMCPSHHVILITNFSVVAFNENDERTCCARLPEDSCRAEFNHSVSYGSYPIWYCSLLQNCDRSYKLYYLSSRLVNLTNDCSATDFMFYLDYTCVTNSTIVNMTHPGVNTSIGEISLSYRRTNYPYFPKINESFYCFCEVTSPDDVPIYPYVYSIMFHVNMRYNSSLSIYSRNWNVIYDRENHDMINIYSGNRFVKYRRLNETLGPMYMVYSGKELSFYDKIWVNFKVLEGKVRTKCDGCKRGKYSPPTFEDSHHTLCTTNYTPTETTENSINQHKTRVNTNTTGREDNGYKYAFITLMVVIAIVGITALVGIVCWRKRRQIQKSNQQEVTDLPVNGVGRGRGRGNGRSKGRGGTRGRGRGANVTNEVSGPAVVSELYESLDRNQTSAVYDNLRQENIYDN